MLTTEFLQTTCWICASEVGSFWHTDQLCLLDGHTYLVCFQKQQPLVLSTCEELAWRYQEMEVRTPPIVSCTATVKNKGMGHEQISDVPNNPYNQNGLVQQWLRSNMNELSYIDCPDLQFQHWSKRSPVSPAVRGTDQAHTPKIWPICSKFCFSCLGWVWPLQNLDKYTRNQPDSESYLGYLQQATGQSLATWWRQKKAAYLTLSFLLSQCGELVRKHLPSCPADAEQCYHSFGVVFLASWWAISCLLLALFWSQLIAAEKNAMNQHSKTPLFESKQWAERGENTG